ncbi:DapH/DapD/GlmU-related protein [Pediococcus pentosaceus]|uniref:DapH/DapD/GlmU-related protein n=1 Tax=Pediococcus pentosaceus TaxID=1255 RepID=UPI0021F09ADD|nr:DapH/DapD/GlmU-related protein [Pediococcus pentosaceus]MCT1176484.1 acyltransferase [Pediococcus pentosaceus]
MRLAKNVRLMPNFFFDSNDIEIGENSFINRNFQQHDGGRNEKICIGRDVMIAMNVTFTSSSHEINRSSSRRAGKGYSKPIIVEDGAWIGAGVIILPGITIGRGSIVAAGAVVTKDIEKNCLYAGVPARKIKVLETV